MHQNFIPKALKEYTKHASNVQQVIKAEEKDLKSVKHNASKRKKRNAY